MYLVIDIGNTRVKKAIFDGDHLVAYCNEERYPISHAILSASGADNISLPAEIATHRLSPLSHLPITIAYDTPHTLGSDRIADACGAWKHFPNRDSLIIDAGTCITIDYLDAHGTYQGGSILPGIEMKFQALNTFTAKLPLVSYCPHTPLTGKSTTDAIRSGVVNATRYEVQGFIDAYRGQHPDMAVVVTGGDAERLQLGGATVDHNLGLVGLNEILKLNTCNTIEP